MKLVAIQEELTVSRIHTSVQNDSLLAIRSWGLYNHLLQVLHGAPVLGPRQNSMFWMVRNHRGLAHLEKSLTQIHNTHIPLGSCEPWWE